jgi:hypothetical protein
LHQVWLLHLIGPYISHFIIKYRPAKMTNRIVVLLPWPHMLQALILHAKILPQLRLLSDDLPHGPLLPHASIPPLLPVGWIHFHANPTAKRLRPVWLFLRAVWRLSPIPTSLRGGSQGHLLLLPLWRMWRAQLLPTPDPQMLLCTRLPRTLQVL